MLVSFFVYMAHILFFVAVLEIANSAWLTMTTAGDDGCVSVFMKYLC